jgi:peroxiredoxin
MGEKLQQGDRFPSLTLKFGEGGTIRFPDEMPTRYAVVLFYRGHW